MGNPIALIRLPSSSLMACPQGKTCVNSASLGKSVGAVCNRRGIMRPATRHFGQDVRRWLLCGAGSSNTCPHAGKTPGLWTFESSEGGEWSKRKGEIGALRGCMPTLDIIALRRGIWSYVIGQRVSFMASSRAERESEVRYSLSLDGGTVVKSNTEVALTTIL